MSNTLKLLESTFSYIPTDKGLNFIVCKEFKETFLNVYELAIAGKHIIAECVDTIDNNPIVKINIEYNDAAYDALFVLKEGEDNIIFNPTTLRYGSKILQTEKKILEEIAADDIVITEDIVVEDIAKPELKLDIEKYKRDALKIIGENYVDKKSKIEDLKASLVSLIEKNLSDIRSASVTDINTIKTQLHESVIEQVNNYKIDTDASITEINNIRENVLTTVDLYVDNIKQVVSDKTEALTSLQESVIYSINDKIAELDVATENHRKEVEAAFAGLSQLADNSSVKITGLVGEIYEDVSKVKQTTIDELNAELVNVTASVNLKLQDLQSKADKKISSISKLVESKISELQTEKDKTHVELVSAKNELVTSLQEAIKTFETETADKTAGLLEIKHQFLEQVKLQSDTISAAVNENKQEIQTLTDKITEAVEEKIKKINLVATKKEDLAQLKKQLEQRIDAESANIKKVVASYGGGGSVAQQFANGGTMRGSLNVTNGQILSGGVDLATIFSSGGGIASGAYLPLSGGVLTGQVSVINGGGQPSSTLTQSSLILDAPSTQCQLTVNSLQFIEAERTCVVSPTYFEFYNSDTTRRFQLYHNPEQSIEEVNSNTPLVGGTLITDNSVWPNINSIGWADAMFYRDGAANTIAQRNGTNPQTFRFYNTFTNSANYERGFTRWNSNVFEIGTEQLGTGSARSLALLTDNNIILGCGATGDIQVGATGTGASGIRLQGAYSAANFLDLNSVTVTLASGATAWPIALVSSGHIWAWPNNAAGSFVVRKAASTSTVGYPTYELLSIAGGAEFRDGVNPQAIYTYNTSTSGNLTYERGFSRWSSNVFQIGTQKLGTGVARAMGLVTDGVERWNISTAGHLLATADSTYDIGALGASRPRNIYAGAKLVTGSNGLIFTYNGAEGYGSITVGGGSLILEPQGGGTLRLNTTTQLNGLLRLEGATSSFPAIKRSGATLQARLADDSAFADFSCASLSATNVVYASGGNSNQWNSTYSTVQSNSASWGGGAAVEDANNIIGLSMFL